MAGDCEKTGRPWELQPDLCRLVNMAGLGTAGDQRNKGRRKGAGVGTQVFFLGLALNRWLLVL